MWSTFRSASFKPVLTEEGKVEQKQCGCTDKDKCPFVSRLVEEMVLENCCLAARVVSLQAAVYV